VVFGEYRATTSESETICGILSVQAVAPLQRRLASFESELQDISSSPSCLDNSYLSSTTLHFTFVKSHHA
jgi:hypothetical protein